MDADLVGEVGQQDLTGSLQYLVRVEGGGQPQARVGQGGQHGQLVAGLGQGLFAQPGQFQPGADTRQQLARGEGFGQVVVGAGVPTLHGFLLAGAGGEQDDGQAGGARVGAQRPDQLEAVHVGHHHVAEHQLHRLRQGHLQGGPAVGGEQHVVVGLQELGEVGAHVGVVVDDQQAGPVGAVGFVRAGAVGGVVGRGGVRGGCRGGDGGGRQPAQRLVHVGRRAAGPAASAFPGDLSGGSGGGLGRGRAGPLGGAEGEVHGEGGALAEAAVHADGAAVRFHQILDQHQAEAAALVGAGAGAADPVEALEQARQLVRGDAGAGVGHGEPGPVAGRGHPHLGAAGEGELQGVAEQVEDDLLPHLPVQGHRLGQRRAVHLQRQPCRLEGGPEHPGQLGRGTGEVDRFEGGVRLPGLGTGDVQEGVDLLQQAQGAALGQLQLLAPLGPVLVGQGLLERAQEQGERGAELVADVGEEGGLGPVELGQRLRPPALLFVRERGRQRPGHSRGEHLQEVVVGPGRGEAGVDAHHQHALHPARAVQRKGQRLLDREAGGRGVLPGHAAAGERGGRQRGRGTVGDHLRQPGRRLRPVGGMQRDGLGRGPEPRGGRRPLHPWLGSQVQDQKRDLVG